MNITKAQPLINYIIKSGDRISSKAGNIADIGVKKQYLTEEDIKIERGIFDIINKLTPNTKFFAEEEHDSFIDDESVWVCDPISGTKLFINGLAHYAIVVSHLTKGIADFAIVYDPSNKDIFIADRESGAFLNNSLLKAKQTKTKRIIFAPTGQSNLTWEDINSIKQKLESHFEVFPSYGSFALNYCQVAIGNFDGVFSVSKDSYPEFAGCFIANMAGYKATNINGVTNFNPTDRKFICGNEKTYNEIYKVVEYLR